MLRAEPGRVASVEPPSRIPELDEASELEAGPVADYEAERWLADLHADGARHEKAMRDLHALLLRAARHEINRRRGALPHLRGGDLDDLAHQAADDALLAILRKLDTFRGESRFTTWAYKFAILEAAVKLRRRAWQGREVPLEPAQWHVLPGLGESPAAATEDRELLEAIRAAIETELSPHQREVLIALALNEVPIDVLTERFNTTRGALYKTLHDARRKLRTHLANTGLRFEEELEAIVQET
jgi:RNA polymerase sigma-70 factor (ECF subfamily)